MMPWRGRAGTLNRSFCHHADTHTQKGLYANPTEETRMMEAWGMMLTAMLMDYRYLHL